MLFGFVVLTLTMITTLKALALAARMTHQLPARVEPLALPPSARSPKISVLVPLFNEERIAEALIKRLSILTYPKALLEVVLVLEA